MAAQRLGVEQLYVFATAAVRDATNREMVLARVEREAGVRPQCLTGADDARLTYLAVHQWYGWSAGRLLVADIGGGSMEIVLGRDAYPELAVSLPLGAGRLTREFLPDDPPCRSQLATLRRHVNATLREVADRLAGAPAQRKGPFVRRALAARSLDIWIPRLAQLPAGQRAKLRGVSHPRARQILAGALVARATMKALDVPVVEVCPWALREGIILHYLQTRLSESLVLPLRPLNQMAAESSPGGWDQDRDHPHGVQAQS